MQCLGAAAAGAGLLALGQIVLDADVGEMIQPGSPRGAGRVDGFAAVSSVDGGAAGSGSASDLGDVEEMTLARVVGEAFAALAEDVAAKQRQGLGQLGVLFLQLVVIRRGLIEHAFELVDAALGVFGLLLGGLGLLPQLVVAAEQVVEELLAFARIVRKSQRDAHDMKLYSLVHVISIRVR